MSIAQQYPVFLDDRIPVRQLKAEYPAIGAMLEVYSLGKTDKKDTVHFCGLVYAAGRQPVFFLPKQSSTRKDVSDIEIATLTMEAFSRYGNEVQSRKGVENISGDSTRLVALITELARDFQNNGIFKDRARYRTRTSGKPDWPRTISREVAYLEDGDAPAFLNLRTTKAADSHSNPLALIQAVVLTEIFDGHSWWLNTLAARRTELLAFPRPLIPRFLWSKVLESLLPSLYGNRVTVLAKNLISYLEAQSDQSDGSFICGVEDFSAVWENMLRNILEGVEAEWNSRLPKPRYERIDGAMAETVPRGMQTDIVLREDDSLKIIDAKYYAASSIGNVPSVPDVVKQYFYHMAIHKLESHTGITSHFVFPAGPASAATYSSVRLHYELGSFHPELPAIQCHYIPVQIVLKSYVHDEKMPFLNLTHQSN